MSLSQLCCWTWITDIKGDPRPRILPRVMVSSAMGLFLRVFADHKGKNKRKTNAFTIRVAFYVFIFMLRPQKMQMTYAPDEPWLF